MAADPAIAICALACRFPDAATPEAFWRNLMEGRRSFRALPPERLTLADYAAERIGAADSITPVQAGLLTDWRFDRGAFRVPRASFDNTDLTHWLALELAAQAWRSIGDALAPHKPATAVVIANSLTGEFSRATMLRLRQPFLDDILAQALEQTGTTPATGELLRAAFRDRLRDRFAEPNEDMLAGGLANTIAGRIANHFDLKGGAFTVDGACSSSLLAVTEAARLLESGAADAVIAGAVDLSLDPFELVGFSRNGALARNRMRVFDQRAEGFWPGEGGAMAVLMRADLAARLGLRVLARLRGWGLSTDGAGGLTRPEAGGQALACARAYASADIDPDDLAYVEAHGTGTAAGDPVEITALASQRGDSAPSLPVGSAKANIGHTKAAAGFAGLVKCVESLGRGHVPGHVGCEEPHAVFRETGDRLRPLTAPLDLSGSAAPLLGVSSFGFGGINAHVVLEGACWRGAGTPATVKAPNVGEQDGEVFLFRAESPARLKPRLAELRALAAPLSLAECLDLAAELAREAQGKPSGGEFRLAFVAANGTDLAARLEMALDWIDRGASPGDVPAGLNTGTGAPARVCLVFPGQSAPVRLPSGIWQRRFPALANVAGGAAKSWSAGATATDQAQPAIVHASLTGLALLRALKVEADTAIGHSVGELGAYVFGGLLTAPAALTIAAARGRLMADLGDSGTGMLRLACTREVADTLVDGSDCCLACFNGEQDQVISGPSVSLAMLRDRASTQGIDAQVLATSHGFHSMAMRAAAAPLRACLEDIPFASPQKQVVSTVTGALLGEDDDPRDLLQRQVEAPVRFHEAVSTLDPQATLFIECGPGTGLTRLLRAGGRTCISLDVAARTLRPVLETCAALFAAGQDLDRSLLFSGRGKRPFDRARVPDLLHNPCGRRRPQDAPAPVNATAAVAPLQVPPASIVVTDRPNGSVLDIVLGIVAAETGLPLSALSPQTRFQTDLHMNSLAVGRIVVAAARQLDIPPLANPTDFADASIEALSADLELLRADGTARDIPATVAGLRPWFAPYAMEWRPADVSTVGAGHRRPAHQTLRLDLAGGFDVAEAVDLVARLRQAAIDKVPAVHITHRGAEVSALLRSAVQEDAFRSVVLVDLNGNEATDARIASLLAAGEGFHEFRLEADGGVSAPVFARTAPRTAPDRTPSGGTLLAVGCHRGIGAECAFVLGRGADRIVFLGRSAETDASVPRLLARARDLGITASYLRCDVGDAEAVAALASHPDLRASPPTALMHAPAVNEPARLTDLDEDAVLRALTPKCTGLDALLRHFGAGLNRLVCFGSIIGRIGLGGEGHYALANAMQSGIAERFARSAPEVSCLSVEWTVWSGAGMGERLGVIEQLRARGVEPIPFEDALGIFAELIERNVTGTLSITGRFGTPRGLVLDRTDGRPLRYTDVPLIDFPGSERIFETELNRGRDPYLTDHGLEGTDILPGVVALEAMAQAADGLCQARATIADIHFHRAIAVAPDGTRIRIAAQREGDGVIAGIFTGDDGFASPCCEARFADGPEPEAEPAAATPAPGTDRPAALDAQTLYGPLFFNGPRFARLSRLTGLCSRHVTAEIGPDKDGMWFGPFEPRDLLLGPPAIADAALHMLQATVPHRRVLPVSISALVATGDLERTARLTGRENWSRGPDYSFEIHALDSDGRCLARWHDARFRAVAELPIAPVLSAAPGLAEVYLERLARERLDDRARVALVARDGVTRESRRLEALSRLGIAAPGRRLDGKPLMPDGGGHLGLAHGARATLAVHAPCPVACDLIDPGERLPEGVTAQDWAQTELLRKLGRREDSARMTTDLRLFTETLAPAGLAVGFGAETPNPRRPSPHRQERLAHEHG